MSNESVNGLTVDQPLAESLDVSFKDAIDMHPKNNDTTGKSLSINSHNYHFILD